MAWSSKCLWAQGTRSFFDHGDCPEAVPSEGSGQQLELSEPQVPYEAVQDQSRKVVPTC